MRACLALQRLVDGAGRSDRGLPKPGEGMAVDPRVINGAQVVRITGPV
jgi:hypothetical protein